MCHWRYLKIYHADFFIIWYFYADNDFLTLTHLVQISMWFSDNISGRIEVNCRILESVEMQANIGTTLFNLGSSSIGSSWIYS